VGMADYSKLSDEELTESLVYMNGRYIERFRPDDEGTDIDSPEAKTFFEQCSALKEVHARRGVTANRGRLDEK
jgi:hypothetical protein